jgi:hypothetical protein
MPRPKRSKLSLTQESIEKHMNEVYSILEHYKQMGVRHYNFVLRIIEELGSDSVEDPVRLQLMAQLEQSRNNSLNAFKEYLRMKTDLITKHLNSVKIFGDLDIKTNKTTKGNNENNSLSKEDQDEVQKMIQELMDMKQTKF